jgi:hypothetical protein
MPDHNSGRRRLRNSFSDEADRMQRSRQRFMVAWYLAMFAIGCVLCWLLLHPETIGSFLGRIASGFHAGTRS